LVYLEVFSAVKVSSGVQQGAEASGEQFARVKGKLSLECRHLIPKGLDFHFADDQFTLAHNSELDLYLSFLDQRGPAYGIYQSL
jgi:hypothetical protein